MSHIEMETAKLTYTYDTTDTRCDRCRELIRKGETVYMTSYGEVLCEDHAPSSQLDTNVCTICSDGGAKPLWGVMEMDDLVRCSACLETVCAVHMERHLNTHK